MDLIYAIPAAIGLGALHSLEPGHGKGVISAYLISSRAKMKDAVLMGIISALAHTLSITLLALTASSTIKFLFGQNLSNWFQLVSGIIVIYLGLNIITQRFNSSAHQHTGCSCSHSTGKLTSETSASWPGLCLTGFFTGLVPCPSALAILLAAISADKIPLGLSLVAAFSVGSALTMVIIGVMVVRVSNSGKHLEKWPVVNYLSLASSVLILFLGGALILQSVSQIGLSPIFQRLNY